MIRTIEELTKKIIHIANIKTSKTFNNIMKDDMIRIYIAMYLHREREQNE